MNRFLDPIVSASLIGAPAFADRKVKHEKAKRSSGKQREMQRMESEAETKANASMNRHLMEGKQKTLGAAASGESGAVVNRLYDAKMKKDAEPSNQTVNSTRQALGQSQEADDLKRVTGRSLQEMENMSNAETEALARKIEKKYEI